MNKVDILIRIRYQGFKLIVTLMEKELGCGQTDTGRGKNN